MEEQNRVIAPEVDDPLLTSIWWWRTLIGVFGAVVVISYLLQFGVTPADAQDKWGQFGDYLGGLLNPVVAFAAFYWLTQSVKLQKQELSETRAELKGATDAQRELVKNGEQSVQIAALTALLGAVNTEVDRIKAHLDEIERARPPMSQAFMMMDYDARYSDKLQAFEAKYTELREEQKSYRQRLLAVLGQESSL